MGRESKHKYSTYALLIFGTIFFIAIIGATLTSTDLDNICNLNNMTLFRYNGTWMCGNLQNILINYTTNNITNIISNYSLNSNNSVCWNGDCRIFSSVVNQNVNTTSMPTFAGATFTQPITIDVPGFVRLIGFTVFGAFDVFEITTVNGYIQIRPTGPFGLNIGLTSSQGDVGFFPFDNGQAAVTHNGSYIVNHIDGTTNIVSSNLNTTHYGNVIENRNLTIIGEFKIVANATTRPCGVAQEGNIYYDGSTKHWYGCNSTNIKQLDN